MTSSQIAEALDETLDRLLHSEEPLAPRLAAYADELRRLNRPFAEAVDRLIARLVEVGAGHSAPQVGEPLEPFLLPDDTGQLLALDSLLGKGPLVVAFRRGHWCPYCLMATDAMARIQRVANERGAQLLVINPERESYSRELKRRTGAEFPILSDMDNAYALSIGLAISVGEEMRDFMAKRGRDLALYQGNAAWILPIPATFVLDRTGTIVMRHIDADYRHRATSESIIAAIEALTVKA